MSISFNKPYLTGKETEYINDAVATKHISGNGKYTKLCQEFLKSRYHPNKVLLTTSCTDALEMTALLLDVRPGDEVIMPSYTFVSTANAFALRGAKIVFADSSPDHPNIDVNSIAGLITDKTKVIVPIHYAGVACKMDELMALANNSDVKVVEDAAQAIDAYYKNEPLGTIGALGTLSFHETKNIISGEGGALFINDQGFADKAEIIWEKGTNRAAFFRGEVDKYGWVDVGSSFLPSDIISAFLYAQLEHLEEIQDRRMKMWNRYHKNLVEAGVDNYLSLPIIPDYAQHNGHIYYLVTNTPEERTVLLKHLKAKGVDAVFHYQSLHKSKYFKESYKGGELQNADRFSECLLRLPLFFELKDDQIDNVCDEIRAFYKS